MKTATVAKFLAMIGVGAVLARVRHWSGIMGRDYHRIGDAAGSVFDRGLWSATAKHLTRKYDSSSRVAASFLHAICPKSLVGSEAATC
jgi:hypothetical protein